MPMRRRRDDGPAPRPPGAGSVSPEPPPSAGGPPETLPYQEPLPEPPPEPEPPGEPRPVDVLARFAAAARALAFAEQAMQAAQRDSADCYRAGDGSWWVAARVPLGTAREMSGLGDGRLYVRVADGYAADRGWGDAAAGGPAAALPDLAPVTLLGLVRVAGLHRVPARPLRETCVLAPGYLVRGVLERAQDLRLRVTYQLARLDPLFGTGVAEAPAGAENIAVSGSPAGPGGTGPGGGGTAPRACYAVWLTAGPASGQPAARTGPGQASTGQEVLPAALLSALADDPFLLVCRPVERTLLIGYGTASPLSDRALAQLVAAEGGGTWLLAAGPDGCARVTWDGEPLDADGLAELGPAHALIDLAGDQPYAEAAAAAHGPVPRPLTLVPAGARAARVDAVLLDDADLDCLPLLLAGDPLADVAVLIRGGTGHDHGAGSGRRAARHLLTAPGGLLTELAVGEPLTCVGPGSVYLPAGYRLDPPVGPAARAALLRPDTRIAQVLLADVRLGYDLDAAEPVWGLWAGPVPELDLQLPRAALADLDHAAREIGEPAGAPERPRPLINRLWPRPAQPQADPAAWRLQAYQAERDRDYVTAAQLYARNNEPLRAARMWEREAEEKY